MSHPWEKEENPQTYELMPSYGENPRPSQHILGLVGGNDVPYKNREIQVDTESDLRGITRANSFCPSRKHHPLTPNIQYIKRDTPKEKVIVQVHTAPLKQSQLWSYPATFTSQPLAIERCARPEKY
jgi:hypothetical protein